MRFPCWSSVVCAALAVLAGCSSYHSKPLDPASVQAALRPPDLRSVQIAASQLKHPLLQPLNIDGRDGFTPDELAVMAVIVSPQLRALRDQRGVAQAQLLQAGILPNPQIGYTLDKLRGDNGPGFVNGRSVGPSWEITALLGYRDRIAAARATAAALDLDIAWQEWQVAEDVRLQAFAVLSLEPRLALAKEAERDLADVLNDVKQAYARGYKTTPEVAAAADAWSTAQDARFAVEQELATHRVQLNLALGQPAEFPLRIKGDGAFPDLPKDAQNADALLDGLENRRLDLVGLAVGYQSSEASLRAAVKAQFPRINLGVSRTNDTSNVRTTTIGVTIDLPIFDRNQGQIAIARATRQQLFDEYVARVTQARADVSKILFQIKILRAQLAALRSQLPELEQIVSSLDQAMKSRNADAQAWRDAHGTLLARRSELWRMQSDLFSLGVALEIASGRSLLISTSPDRTISRP